MECNKDEAARAKEIAEKKMEKNDFEGPHKIALKAQNLYPELENITQILAVCNVHCAAKNEIWGFEKDWYRILGIEKLADEFTIKKQYRQLAFVLHPDKNRFPGAEAAFKLIVEANLVLSHPVKRYSFDHRSGFSNPSFTKKYGVQRKTQSGFHDKFFGLDQYQATGSNLIVGQGMFWTSCPSCSEKLQHQREYVNRFLLCPNCLKPFMSYDIDAQGISLGYKCSQPRYSRVFSKTSWTKHAVSQQTGNPSQHAPKMGVQNDIRFPAPGAGSQGIASNKTLGSESGMQTESTAKVSEDVKVKEKESWNANSMNGGKEGGGMPNGNTVTIISGDVKKKNRKRDSMNIVECKSGDTPSSVDTDDVPAGKRDSEPNCFRFARKLIQQSKHISGIEIADDNEHDDFAIPPKRSRGSGDSKEKQKDTLDNDDLKCGNDNISSFPTDANNVESKMKQMGTSPKESLLDKNIGNEELNARGEAGNMPGTGATKTEEIDDTQSDSDAKIIECPDAEFNNFDEAKEESCFSVDQIWACFDTLDGMPRFYALVKKVFSPGFKLVVTWLEADPEDEVDKNWARKELPVGCGRFKLEKSQYTSDRLTFSHQVLYEKGKIRSSFVIYPRKGETWALFKDWDIRWSCNRMNLKHFEYEIVVVLSDFVARDGVKVAYLDKVSGFVSLFQRTGKSDNDSFFIWPRELFRFSHRIPFFRMTGTERSGVPEDSFELDPNSLPLNPDDLWYPSMAKVCSGNMDEHISNTESDDDSEHEDIHIPVKRSWGIDGSTNGEGQKDTLDSKDLKCGNVNSFLTDAENSRTEEIDDSQSDSDVKVIECPDAEFNNFDKAIEESCFSVDQMWACFDTLDYMPRFYTLVKKVFSPEFKLVVTWLEADLPVGCGRFKREKSQYTSDRLIFSHQVLYEKGKIRGSFVIYPRKGETWALFKDWDIRWSCNRKNFKHFEYEIVEVLSDFVAGDGVKVAYLDKVSGFVSLFQRTGKSDDDSFFIRPRELFRFSHRIPFVRMTGAERSGVPEDSFELDPSSLPLNPDDLWYPSMAKVCNRNMDEHISYSESDDDIPIPVKRSQGSTNEEGQKDSLDSKDLKCGNTSNFPTNTGNAKSKVKQMDPMKN